MKKLKFTLLSLFTATIIFYACKKVEINSQLYVQRTLVGKWPSKLYIKSTYTDNKLTKLDSVKYDPIDTVVFTAEGKMIRRNKTIKSEASYTISEDGEKISITTGTTTITKQLSAVSISKIGIASEAVSGSVKVVEEEQLLRY